MRPSDDLQSDRVRACVADLAENGIDLLDADDEEIREVVYDNLDYFQLMLGTEAEPAEVIAHFFATKRADLGDSWSKPVD